MLLPPLNRQRFFVVIIVVDDISRLIDFRARKNGGDFSRLFHGHDVASASDVLVSVFVDRCRRHRFRVDFVKVRVGRTSVNDLHKNCLYY